MLAAVLWGGHVSAEAGMGLNSAGLECRLRLGLVSVPSAAGGGLEEGWAVDTVLSPGVTAAGGGQDRWLAPDKAKHLVISAGLVWGVYRIYRGELHNDRRDSRAVAAGLTGLIGLTKEIRDRRFSVRDLVADGLGIGLGLVFFTS